MTVGNGWYWVSATRVGNFTAQDSIGLRSVAAKLRNRRVKASKMSKAKGGEGERDGGGEGTMEVDEATKVDSDQAAQNPKADSMAASEEEEEVSKETQLNTNSENSSKDTEQGDTEEMDTEAPNPGKDDCQTSPALQPVPAKLTSPTRLEHSWTSCSPLYQRLLSSTRNWGNIADKKDAQLAKELFSRLPEKVTDCEVINVSEAMLNRTHYAKMTKPYSKLDSLLERRTKLEELEAKQRHALEQQILWKTKLEHKAKQAKAEKDKAKAESSANGLVKSGHPGSSKGCYSLLCRTMGPQACYSPICRISTAADPLEVDRAKLETESVKTELVADFLKTEVDDVEETEETKKEINKEEAEVKKEVDMAKDSDSSSQDANCGDVSVEMAAKAVKDEPMDVDSSTNPDANVSVDDEEIDVEGDKEGENSNSSSASDKLINSVQTKSENGLEGDTSKAASKVEEDTDKKTSLLHPKPSSSSSVGSDGQASAQSGKDKVSDMPPGIKDAVSVAHILSARPGITLSQAQQALVQAIMKMSTAELRAKMPPVRKISHKFKLPRSSRTAAKQRNKAMKKAGLPTCQKFQTTSKRKSIFVLESHELYKLARRGGFKETPGFNYNCKMNNVGWIYPCPRPFFKTAWRFRTQTLSSLAAAALQLHILWACTRWDDMAVKPPAGGTNTISTETEITTTELLKRRDTGPHGIRSEFLVRKIVVPLGITSQPKGK